jgi:hypothetical protein
VISTSTATAGVKVYDGTHPEDLAINNRIFIRKGKTAYKRAAGVKMGGNKRVNGRDTSHYCYVYYTPHHNTYSNYCTIPAHLQSVQC